MPNIRRSSRIRARYASCTRTVDVAMKEMRLFLDLPKEINIVADQKFFTGLEILRNLLTIILSLILR
jgi:hypothetical protein